MAERWSDLHRRLHQQLLQQRDLLPSLELGRREPRAERHEALTDGQRSFDLEIATNNVAGGLLDLQAAGRLAPEIDPIEVALAIEERYRFYSYGDAMLIR